MPEHPNVALIRKGYEALAQGDITAVRDLWSDQIVWHLFGSNPLSGDHWGTDAVLALLGKIAQLTGGTIRAEVHDIVAGDEHAVALTRRIATRGEKRLDHRLVDVYHVRDGRVVEVWSFAEDQRVADEFWSDE